MVLKEIQGFRLIQSGQGLLESPCECCNEPLGFTSHEKKMTYKILPYLLKLTSQTLGSLPHIVQYSILSTLLNFLYVCVNFYRGFLSSHSDLLPPQIPAHGILFQSRSTHPILPRLFFFPRNFPIKIFFVIFDK